MPTARFMNALPTDESEYQSWLVMTTARELVALIQGGNITLDPRYQRGLTPATKTTPPLHLRDTKKGRAHINALAADLADRNPATGRDRATFPAIWLNARREKDGTPRVLFDETTGALNYTDKTPFYEIDGSHRDAALRQAVENQTCNPQRRVMVMILDAPEGYEATVFRKLNSQMGVIPNRIAFISAARGQDLYRVAWDFVIHNGNLSSPAKTEFNFETTKKNAAKNNFCHFLSITDGLTPWTEIDPTNQSDCNLLVSYLSSYWDRVVTLLPSLGWLSAAERLKAYKTYPLLRSSVVTALLRLAHSYLESADIGIQAFGLSGRDLTIKKLHMLQSQASQDLLFASLTKIKPALFTKGGHAWGALATSPTSGGFTSGGKLVISGVTKELKSIIGLSATTVIPVLPPLQAATAGS